MKQVQSKMAGWQFGMLEYLAYATVFIIPLYVNYSHWFPFSTPKSLLLTGTVCIMIVLYAWGSYEARATVRLTMLHIVLGIFFSVLTLSALFGVDPKHSFFGTFTPMVSLFLFYAIGAFACLIGFLIQRNAHFLPRLLTAAFVSSAIVAGITYKGADVIPLSNDASTIGNNSYLGAYLLLTTCIGIGLFFWYQKTWQRVGLGLGTALLLLSPVFMNREVWSGSLALSEILHNPTLLLGQANGAAIGLGIAVVVMVLLQVTRVAKRSIAWAGGVLFVFFTAALVLTGVSLLNPDSVIHRVYVAQKTENRFMFWNIAQQGFVDRPLLGYGPGNYSYIYQKHFNTDVYKKGNAVEIWVDQPHNVFLEHLSTAGVLGLIVYCLLIGFVCIKLYQLSGVGDRSKKIWSIVLAGAVFGYVVQNMFIFDTVVPLLILFVIIGITMGFSDPVEGQVSDWLEHVKKPLQVSLIVMSIIALVVLVVLPWKESKRWGAFATEKNLPDLAKAQQGVQDISLVGDIEDTAYLSDKLLKKIEQTLPSITPDTKGLVLGEIDALVGHLEAELVGQPQSFRGHLVAGSLLLTRLSITKDEDPIVLARTKEHFFAAQKINPQNPLVYVNLARTYALEGDTTHVYAYIRAAMATAPEFKSSYIFAREVLKVAPNKDFQSYVDHMTALWLNNS